MSSDCADGYAFDAASDQCEPCTKKCGSGVAICSSSDFSGGKCKCADGTLQDGPCTECAQEGTAYYSDEYGCLVCGKECEPKDDGTHQECAFDGDEHVEVCKASTPGVQSASLATRPQSPNNLQYPLEDIARHVVVAAQRSVKAYRYGEKLEWSKLSGVYLTNGTDVDSLRASYAEKHKGANLPAGKSLSDVESYEVY